jgi:hypothetical protein
LHHQLLLQSPQFLRRLLLINQQSKTLKSKLLLLPLLLLLKRRTKMTVTVGTWRKVRGRGRKPMKHLTSQPGKYQTNQAMSLSPQRFGHPPSLPPSLACSRLILLLRRWPWPPNKEDSPDLQDLKKRSPLERKANKERHRKVEELDLELEIMERYCNCHQCACPLTELSHASPPLPSKQGGGSTQQE